MSITINKTRHFLTIAFFAWVSHSVAAPALAPDSHCDTHVHVNCGHTPNAIFTPSETSALADMLVVFVQNDHVFFVRSSDFGATYSTPIAINPVPERIYADGENRPKIALGKQREIYISWTQKTNGRYTGDIRFSRSLDHGKTFSTPVVINNDGLLTGHRFDTLQVSDSGNVYLAWLDKRDQVSARKSGQPYTGSALYFAVSTNAGESFLGSKTSKNYRVADNSCECCRIAIAPHRKHDAAVMWRHIFNESTRDHAFAIIRADGSSSVERATVDHWKINACPHHGPDLTLDNTAATQDQFHMVWFSNGDRHQGIYYRRRGASAQDHLPAYSVDNSAGASHPQIASVTVNVKNAKNVEKLYIAWKLFDGKESRIRLIQSSDNGVSWIDRGTVLSTDGRSDHPLLLAHKNELYLTWHTQKEGFRVTAIQ